MIRKKKIILYNPKAVFYDMPLALLSIGTQVRENFEVIIIDARIENDVDTSLSEHLNDTIIVGVTSLTGAPLNDAIAFTRKVKALKKDLLLVWGGWHASLFPEKVLEEIHEVDVVVQGQGEITFKELVDQYSKGESFGNIKGIVYRNQEEICKTPPRIISDMNELPRVDYDLIDVEKYFAAKKRRQFDYISSIGCFFRCTFCADPFVFNRKFSSYAPDRIAEDLLHYHSKYQFDDLNFQDETFFTYPKKILSMANQLREAGTPFTWAATMRADQGGRMSKEDFKLCQEGGLRRLLIGVESGSQEMMDWLSKDIKKEDVLKCADWCAELGINVIFPFIVGFPGESEESVEESKRLIRQLSFKSSGFETPIFYFKPYPGTKITEDVVASGEFVLPQSIEEWATFDYIGSKGPWVSDEKYEMIERLKFYLKLYRKRDRFIMKPFTFIAKRRLNSFNFKFPIEKRVVQMITKEEALS